MEDSPWDVFYDLWYMSKGTCGMLGCRLNMLFLVHETCSMFYKLCATALGACSVHHKTYSLVQERCCIIWGACFTDHTSTTHGFWSMVHVLWIMNVLAGPSKLVHGSWKMCYGSLYDPSGLVYGLWSTFYRACVMLCRPCDMFYGNETIASVHGAWCVAHETCSTVDGTCAIVYTICSMVRETVSMVHGL